MSNLPNFILGLLRDSIRIYKLQNRFKGSYHYIVVLLTLPFEWFISTKLAKLEFVIEVVASRFQTRVLEFRRHIDTKR